MWYEISVFCLWCLVGVFEPYKDILIPIDDFRLNIRFEVIGFATPSPKREESKKIKPTIFGKIWSKNGSEYASVPTFVQEVSSNASHLCHWFVSHISQLCKRFSTIFHSSCETKSPKAKETQQTIHWLRKCSMPCDIGLIFWRLNATVQAFQMLFIFCSFSSFSQFRIIFALWCHLHVIFVWFSLHFVICCYFDVIFMSFCVILSAGLPTPSCSQCYVPGRIMATADHRELPCS